MAKDTKQIEEKALNFFRTFIENSEVISSYIAENDKEPCWDGHLYLYSDGRKDKDHLQGRVPVQIKGTEVAKIQTKNWKFKLYKNDLKAYLHEPTFFIVCQIEKDTNKKILFYRDLLPNRIRKLLKDMGGQQSRMTLFHPLTQDLNEFEGQLSVFLANSRKMTSFAGNKPFSISEALKKGIKEFTFITPSSVSGRRQLLYYLSTHSTQLYAKISDYNIDIPISDGPARFRFSREGDGDVRVGDKVFYRGYSSEIIDGRVVITVAEDLTMSFPLDDKDQTAPILRMSPQARYLKETIREAEFMLAMNDAGSLSVGSMEFQVSTSETNRIDDLRKKLNGWKELSRVLDKLHVTKALDLTEITQEQETIIDALIETVGKGNAIQNSVQESSLLVWDVGNIRLLLWCVVDQEGLCHIGDFFDKSFDIFIENDEQRKVKVSPYSYLQKENLWESVDNIDYNGIVESAHRAAQMDAFCYQMSNYDVLSMINSADKLEHIDHERRDRLLIEALKLNDWLIDSDPSQEMKTVHLINRMQILKRQRYLSNEELDTLYRMIHYEKVEDYLKFAAYLLMDNHQEADNLFVTFSKEDQEVLRSYPIWYFYNVN